MPSPELTIDVTKHELDRILIGFGAFLDAIERARGTAPAPVLQLVEKGEDDA